MRADLKPVFCWKGMKADIVNLVARCLECQQAKAELRHCWIAIDGKETRLDLVVVDTLTRSAHFIPVRTTYQAPDLVRVFIRRL
jgi:hypothetical protein